jgi:hypothetical protein
MADKQTLADYFEAADEFAVMSNHATLGDGYDPIAEKRQRPRVISSEAGNLVKDPTVIGEGATVTIFDRSYQDLNRLETESISVRLRAAFVGGSASLSASQSERLTEERSEVASRLVHQSWRIATFQGYDSPSDLRLVGEWEQVRRSADASVRGIEFKRKFGTNFVAGVYTGREIRVVFEAKVNRTLKQKELERQLEVAGSYGGVTAEAKASQVAHMRELTENARVTCRISYRGRYDPAQKPPTEAAVVFERDRIDENFQEITNRFNAYESNLLDVSVGVSLYSLSDLYPGLDYATVDSREFRMRELFSRLQEVEVQYKTAEYYRTVRRIDDANETGIIAKLDILEKFLASRRNALIATGKQILSAPTDDAAAKVDDPTSEFDIAPKYTEQQAMDAGLQVNGGKASVPVPFQNSLLNRLAQYCPRQLRVNVTSLSGQWGELAITLKILLDGEPVAICEELFSGGVIGQNRFPNRTYVVSLVSTWQFLTFEVATRGRDGTHVCDKTIQNNAGVTPTDFPIDVPKELTVSFDNKTYSPDTYLASGNWLVLVSGEEN